MVKCFFRFLSRYGSCGVLIILLLSVLAGAIASVILRKAGYLAPLAAVTIIVISALSLGLFVSLIYLKYLREGGVE